MREEEKLNEREVLIDKWFPVGEVSVESVRERSVGENPPLNRMHIWFARRPLCASRAAVLASILPPTADKNQFIRFLGIPPHADVLGAARALERARALGTRVENPFKWERAYKTNVSDVLLKQLAGSLEDSWPPSPPVILDPMAGGGSIPYEAVRMGLPAHAGELNPVAYIILKATLEYPVRFGKRLSNEVREFCEGVHRAAKPELEAFFPPIDDRHAVHSYFWARTVRCPDCALRVPLSPNWSLVKSKTKKDLGIRPRVPTTGDVCTFEIVPNPAAKGFDVEAGTWSDGDAICLRRGVVIDGQYIKAEAKAGRLGHQLYAVSAKKPRRGKRGKEWTFQTPTDSQLAAVEAAEKALMQRLPSWEVAGLVPDEDFPKDANDTRPIQYGMPKWKDLFNPRQLLVHLTYAEKFRVERDKLFEGIQQGSEEWEFAKAIVTYGAIVMDTCLSYNTMESRWHRSRLVIAGFGDLQAFPFRPSYAEWNQTVPGAGYEWAVSKVLDALEEIIGLLPQRPGPPTVYIGDAARLPYADATIPSIVVDPPYRENVMYAEISDFFYVWLKRLIGDLYPEAFKDELTNKSDEAVASRALYADAGRGKAKRLAESHYQSKMEACFKEMHRVLRNDGVLTVMFTHRKAEAWGSLTEALMNAGFTFRASWPVHTESSDKFGKKGKGVLRVTVLLACRKRAEGKKGLWEEIQREIRQEAEEKVREYHEELGLDGPDLLVSAYGPVLGVFADYELVKDSVGHRKRPKDALDIVAEAVNTFTTADIAGADFDTLSYLNLIRSFPGLIAQYDLARLTTVFGGNTTLDNLDIKGGRGLVQKKGDKVKILTSQERVGRGIVNPAKPNSLHTLVDVVHASLVAYEGQGIAAVTNLLRETGRDAADSGYLGVLRAIARIALNQGISDEMEGEARTANVLLEALGHEPESFQKRGERLTHYMEEE